jgi:hypothetical protein
MGCVRRRVYPRDLSDDRRNFVIELARRRTGRQRAERVPCSDYLCSNVPQALVLCPIHRVGVVMLHGSLFEATSAR